MIFFFLFTGVYSISIIPNEEGFGLKTSAGRGGEIYIISNLNPSGKGSLKECVDAKGPRICLFEVSGTISLSENLKITNPYITIAGQTAPSPGILIKGAGIDIQASEVLIQHLRIRVGDNLNGPNFESRDGISIGSNSGHIKNIVIDHVSTSWAVDELLGVWSERGSVTNVSIINSIFSEALHRSKHPDGAHSMGALIGKNVQNFYFGKNILAFNNGRNPLIRDDVTDVLISNNYIYHPGLGSKSKIYIGTRGSKNIPLRASIIGNDFEANPNDYYFNTIYIENEAASSLKIYIEDNGGPEKSNLDPWAIVHPYSRKDFTVRSFSSPVNAGITNFIPSYEVKNTLIKNSGARPKDRDFVDIRVLNNILFGTGNIIDSQKDVGGWPNLKNNYQKILIPQNPHADDNGNGYTNIEELLHLYSYWVEKDINKHPLKIIENINNFFGTNTSTINTTINTTINNKEPKIINSNIKISDLGVQIEIETDKLSYCHYDERENISYYDQKGRFLNSYSEEDYSTHHKVLLSGLEESKIYRYNFRCRDLEHNVMDYDYVLEFTNELEEIEIINISAEPKIIDFNFKISDLGVEIEIETDTIAYCHYDERENISYYHQRGLFDETYSTLHRVLISGIDANDKFRYYLRCRDGEHNVMDYDYVLESSNYKIDSGSLVSRSSN